MSQRFASLDRGGRVLKQGELHIHHSYLWTEQIHLAEASLPSSASSVGNRRYRAPENLRLRPDCDEGRTNGRQYVATELLRGRLLTHCPTDFPRTADGRVYHLGVRPGEVANRIVSIRQGRIAVKRRLTFDRSLWARPRARIPWRRC